MAKSKPAQTLTTAQQLGSIVKSARDIMRKDKGLNGDLDRLPMLTWIMFLKFLDDMEHIREQESTMAGKRFRAAIEPPYRWRDWAAIADGVTGDELIAFVNNEEAVRPDGTKGAGLFTYLRSLQGANGGDRRDVIATVFKGTINRMINGYLLRDVINKIDAIHFTSSEEIHVLGSLYESMLKEMRDAAGDSGEFYTPRSVVRFMVRIINPQVGETVLDPATGTGGFLVESFLHLRKQCRTVSDERALQTRSILGYEPKPLPYLLSQMNLLLHGLETPKIDPSNALGVKITEIGPKDRVDVILTNPPFGGEEERGIQGNFPEDKRTAETALLFLQLIMRKLNRRTGTSRAAVVVPDGTLSSAGVAAAIRQTLVSDFNLYAIVQLPPGAFAPYAETARTNILFFDTQGTTEEIWYYQIPAPNGRKQCSKNNPLTDIDFEPVVQSWLKPNSSPNSWIVKRSDIDPTVSDLLRRNPTVTNLSTGLELVEVVQRAAESLKGSLEDLRRLEQTLSFQNPEPRPLRELLKRRQQVVFVQDATEYKQLTVQYHHRGVRLRGITSGKEIGTKRQFAVTDGQVVLSRIDARYGAIGLVPPDLDGAIITGDFWAFDVDESQALPKYLDLFFGLPEFANLCERASRGTTRRQRLVFDLFESISIPWLQLDDQLLVINRVEAAARVVSNVGTLVDELRELPTELIRKMFGFVWIEENVERMLAANALV